MQSISAFLRLLLVATDTYRLRTQLWPALLALLPVFEPLVAEHRVDAPKILPLAALFVGAGGVWFLCQVIHACGQRRQRQLFKRGGRPAVRMLRHRDTTVSRVTKQAWHLLLAKRSGIPFPTRAEERFDPAAADAIYERAVAGCERHTDRSASPALWQERIEYEFLVNGLALRWIGLMTAMGAVLWTCTDHTSLSFGLRPGLQLAAFVSLRIGSASFVLVAVLMALAWVFFFTPHRARSAAWSYDLHLLESAGVGVESGLPRIYPARN